MQAPASLRAPLQPLTQQAAVAAAGDGGGSGSGGCGLGMSITVPLPPRDFGWISAARAKRATKTEISQPQLLLGGGRASAP